MTNKAIKSELKRFGPDHLINIKSLYQKQISSGGASGFYRDLREGGVSGVLYRLYALYGFGHFRLWCNPFTKK